MSELVLIDEITLQNGESDPAYSTYFVRLTAESSSEITLGAFKPISLIIEEGFGKTVVDCKIVLEDLVGTFVNVKPVEGSFIFNLYIGRSPESTVNYKMRLKAVRNENMQLGESAGYRVELHLTSSHWQSTTHDRQFKSWRNVPYSQAVTDMINDSGLVPIFVSPTEGSKRHIMNPNWTRKQMMDWIRERCKGTNGDTFFTYAALPNNMFFYSTFSDLIKGNINNTIDFEPLDPREFVVSGEGINGDNSRRRLYDFKVESNYVQELRSGASGVSYGYYDYDTRSYVKGSHTFSESQEAQLSDWAMISEDQETVGTFHFGHRNKEETEQIAKAKVSLEINKIHDVITSTMGYCDVQVGELVDVLIPINPEFLDTKFNEFFSGEYVVSYKRTYCNLESSMANTVFRMTRQGINSPNVNTLAQSQRGKVV